MSHDPAVVWSAIIDVERQLEAAGVPCTVRRRDTPLMDGCCRTRRQFAQHIVEMVLQQFTNPEG